MELQTDNYNWIDEGPELTEESYEGLVEEFPLISDIIRSSLRDLQKIPGVGLSYARKIKLFANEINESKYGDDPKSVINSELLDHEPSPEELEDEEEDEDPQKEYVLVELEVDKFYTQRKRIEVGPATCRECGYDVIKVNNLPPFEDLPSSDKSEIRRTLEKHMENYHSTPSGKKIISEKEMKRTDWTNPQVLKP